jgi:hypothetical protein
MEPTDPIAAHPQTLYTLLDEAAAIDGLAPLDLAAERTLLDQLRAQRYRPLRVAVIGEFSTGKSTFINAILGQDLLPARFLPTTRQVMRLHHSDDPPHVAVADDDLADSMDMRAEPPASRPLIRDAVRELADTGQPLDLALPIPAPWSDFVIYDTPGVNDATSMAESVIFDLMDEVDVVVMMLRAQQALTATEGAFLGQLVRHKDLDKFFFNINFADSQTPEQAQATRAYVAATLGELRNWPIRSLHERVFLCSARRTLDGVLGGDEVITETPSNEHLNEHGALLAAVHAFATTRRQTLLDEAADGLLRTVTESAARKLTAALDAADDEDAHQGQAILAITAAVTDFRVAVREEELALRQRLSERKAALLVEVTDAFAGIERELSDWVGATSLEELAGEGPAKRLRLAAEERLTPLLATFREDVGQACADLDQRIAPVVSRTSDQLQGLRQGLDLGPLLAGTSLATAGYFLVSATLPWVLGATGALAVTAGLASLVPGVGGAVGALVGAGLGAAATGLPRLLTGIASGAAGGYRWLRDITRNWQEQRTRADYEAQLRTLVAELRRQVMTRIDAAIDPARIIEGALTARFPEALLLEERRLQVARLDRDRLRDIRQGLSDLRGRFIAAIPPPQGRPGLDAPEDSAHA